MRVWLLLMAVLLAGCTDPGPTPLYVQEDAGSSSTLVDPNLVPDTDGDGEPNLEEVVPAWVNVTVRDANDSTPINGTGVVFRLFDCDWCDASIQEVGLRTDVLGQVSLQIYAEVQVEVIAGDHEAYTTEVAPRVQTVLGIERTVALRLYSVSLAKDVQDSYPLALHEEGRHGFGDDQRTQDWDFHASPDVQAAYMERLDRVDVTISWNNSEEGSAWLRGLVGPQGSGGYYRLTDGAGSPSFLAGRESGAHEFTLNWDVAAFRQDAGLPTGLRIGALLDSSAISLDGLDYAVHAVATFQGSERFEVRID